MAQSLIIPRSEMVRGTRPEHPLPWKVVFWVSAGLTVIGWLDIGFLWAPLRVDEMGWRFEVIAATVDALPLATIGLAALLVASVQRASRSALACVATLGTGICMILLVLTAWFVATGLRTQPTVSPDALSRVEILRTTIFAFLYVVIYSLITASAAQRLLDKHGVSAPH